MGAFLTNYQVRSESVSAVRTALAPLVTLRAYISPPKNGWITVYDETSDEQDDEVLRRIAGGLSRSLNTSVLAFLVHDSDVMAYWLYEQGELEDEFNSAPDYFDQELDETSRERLAGKTEALLRLCVPGTTGEQLEAVLHPAEGPPLMAEGLLADLAPLLGIDGARIALGFTYFEQEGEHLLPDIADFVPVSETAQRKAAKVRDRPEEKGRPKVDPFAFAVGMLAESWSVRQLLSVQLGTLQSVGADFENMVKSLQRQFDRTAQDALKRGKVEGRPSFDELKAARDQGPRALAALVFQQFPQLLTEIAVSSVAVGQNEGPKPSGQEPFIDALLEHGLDPNGMSCHGVTPLSLAERHGKSSKLYQMLKAAADQQS